MSLDKQRILHELGNVMNQLQNADCGCIGKLFSTPTHGGQGGTTVPASPVVGACRPGCYNGHSCNYNLNTSHGCNHGTPGAGDPAHPMNYPSHMNPQCNPSKLYTDTYSYLNQNLVQPVVQEVYNDLKSLTPDNTIMNNSLAANMNITSGANKHSELVNMNAPMGYSNVENRFDINPAGKYQPTANTGGMGPQIVNMMMGDGNKDNSQKLPAQGGQISGSVVNNSIQDSNNNPCNITPNPHVIQANNALPVTNLSPGQLIKNSLHAAPNNISSPLQQKDLSNQYPYGQHTQAIMKFNQMFPGVAQEGLGYDPMAIAIQMNPANQQKTAMNTMQKLNAVQPQVTQFQQNNVPFGGKQINEPRIQGDNQMLAPSEQHLQNNMNTAAGHAFAEHQQQKQVYLNPEVALSQQQSPSHNQLPYYDAQDPNLRASNSGGHQQTELPPNNNKMFRPKDVLKEPILPFDNQSKVTPLKNYEYNTLGQSIERFPAHLYHTPETNLPQTLSPQSTPKQRNNPNYSNVKFSESKTSLIGNKGTRKTPSRNQLQHIYNQYKGSQSYTQQSLNPVVMYGSTLSDGKLNVVQAHQNDTQLKVPVEKFGGDTIANMQGVCDNGPSHKVVAEEHGLIPATPQGDSELVKPTSGIPTRQAKCRNGLQDVVYTSYPSSAAWSFHGTQNYRVASGGSRFRR